MNAIDSNFSFNEMALKIGGQRQQVIASNIANADTPNFKATNVDFADALARATGETGNKRSLPPVAVTTTHPGHLGHAAVGSVVLSTADLAPSKSTQPSIDGNTVDLDAERAAFADNTVRYEASFAFLNHQMKTLMSSVQG